MNIKKSRVWLRTQDDPPTELVDMSRVDLSDWESVPPKYLLWNQLTTKNWVSKYEKAEVAGVNRDVAMGSVV